MNELGRLEDLPADYVAELRALNLVPLWPSLRGVLPPDKPRPHTEAAFWSYQALRPLLLKAGELTPIEKAERRVLVLANPGHGLDKMQASAAIYLGIHGSMASATSKKMELKLTGVARASLEELLLDYEDYLRQHKLRL